METDRLENITSLFTTEDSEGVLWLYESIYELYNKWGVNTPPLIETSAKFSGRSFNPNRYSIPIFQEYDINLDKIYEILDILDAPVKLYETVKQRHNYDIRALAGIDYTEGKNKIYFYNNFIKTITCYQWNKNTINEKLYNLQSKDDFNDIYNSIIQIFGRRREFNNLKSLIPVSNWLNVYDKTNLTSSYNVTGYHICLKEKKSLSDFSRVMCSVSKDILSNEYFSLFKEWLYKNSSKKIYWVSIAQNPKENTPEITLYLRLN